MTAARNARLVAGALTGTALLATSAALAAAEVVTPHPVVPATVTPHLVSPAPTAPSPSSPASSPGASPVPAPEPGPVPSAPAPEPDPSPPRYEPNDPRCDGSCLGAHAADLARRVHESGPDWGHGFSAEEYEARRALIAEGFDRVETEQVLDLIHEVTHLGDAIREALGIAGGGGGPLDDEILWEQ